MNSDYEKVWNVMNDLEMVTSKIVSAREIIDTAAESIQKHEYDKAETLAMASYEFLGYYLEEFDAKFKLAWQETVVKQKKEEDHCMPPWGHSDLEYVSHYSGSTVSSCDKDDPSPECKGAWNSFWEEHSEHYYDYTRNDPNRLNPFSGKVYESPDGGKTVYARNPGETERTLVKEDKVVKWVLPVQQKIEDGIDDYYVQFPDDLLEKTNLKEGDTVEWVDKGDGSYIIRKVTKPLGPDEC